MRNNPPLIFLSLSLLTLLSACAGMQPARGPDTTQSLTIAAPISTTERLSTSPSFTAEEQDLPTVDLNGELLYQILAAEIALQRQYFTAGTNEYIRLAERTRDPRFAERATQVALLTYENDAALRASRLWVELAPDRSEPRQMAAVAAIRAGELEEAFGHMEVLLSGADAVSEERFERMAGLLSREHDVQEAFRLMQRFVETRRDDPGALYAYAHLAVRAGEMEKARQAIDAALDLRPGWHDAMALRIRILLLTDGPDAAIAYLSDAVRDYPKDASLRLAYARTLAEMRHYQEALDQYGLLAKQVVPNTDVLLSMA
ncbi:MAG: tetratricopeptide repeat protein, partial [Chromatiales bacterium]|nr:tetratricopeptide repeat protein [Chromatiales bacterium]